MGAGPVQRRCVSGAVRAEQPVPLQRDSGECGWAGRAGGWLVGRESEERCRFRRLFCFVLSVFLVFDFFGLFVFLGLVCFFVCLFLCVLFVFCFAAHYLTGPSVRRGGAMRTVSSRPVLRCVLVVCCCAAPYSFAGSAGVALLGWTRQGVTLERRVFVVSPRLSVVVSWAVHRRWR